MHTWIRSERASCTKSLHGNPRSVSPRKTPPLSLFDFGLLAQGKKKHEDCPNHKHNISQVTVHKCLPGVGAPYPNAFLMPDFYDRLYVAFRFWGEGVTFAFAHAF